AKAALYVDSVPVIAQFFGSGRVCADEIALNHISRATEKENPVLVVGNDVARAGLHAANEIAGAAIKHTNPFRPIAESVRAGRIHAYKFALNHVPFSGFNVNAK